jgi:hypothetical protein
MTDYLAPMPFKKIIFRSVEEARLALSNDRLGCVYRKAREVYIITAFGSGVFPTETWDREETKNHADRTES